MGALQSLTAGARHTLSEAETDFGAAFATACGDVHQVVSNDRSLRHGLITDLASRVAAADVRDEAHTIVAAHAEFPTVVERGVQHRFHMSASAAEVGVGLPTDGFECFTKTMASLLGLHVFSALCARAQGLAVGDEPVEPLHALKRWARKHGFEAQRVVEAALTTCVTTQAEARAKLLEIGTNAFVGEGADVTVCAVVVQNSRHAPFADVFAGVVVRQGPASRPRVGPWLVLHAAHRARRSDAAGPAGGVGGDVQDGLPVPHRRGRAACAVRGPARAEAGGGGWRVAERAVGCGT